VLSYDSTLFSTRGGVSASAAEIFHGFAPEESVPHGADPGRIQKDGQIVREDVAQTDSSLAVQTAGHHGSVRENPHVIPGAAASDLPERLSGVLVRPVEDFLMLQIAQRCQEDSPGRFFPVSREKRVKPFFDPAVQGILPRPVRAVLVPEAQGHDGAVVRRFPGKGEASVKVRFRPIRDGTAEIGLPGVQGQADLVGMGVQQCSRHLRNADAVGGQSNVHTGLPGDAKKGGQGRMQQRLSHDVQIQIFGQRSNFLHGQRKFRLAHEPWRTCGFRAKGTGQVAYVGDFQIYTGQHGASFRIF